MMGIASAWGAMRAAKAQRMHEFLSAKMACIPGAYRVQVKDGQIIIHAKTRIPKVTR